MDKEVKSYKLKVKSADNMSNYIISYPSDYRRHKTT